MDDSIFEDVSDGIGMDFGSPIHEFAEDYALDKNVTPASDDKEHIKVLLDSLPGELRVEERAYLPLEVFGASPYRSTIWWTRSAESCTMMDLPQAVVESRVFVPT